MSKYGDDIRRIARVKDEKDPNVEQAPAKRPTIDGQRGVAYYDANGVIKTSSLRPGATLPDTTAATLKAITDKLAAAKAAAGNEEGNDQGPKPAGNGGSSNQTPTDIKDLIDGTVDAAGASDVPINLLDGMVDPYYGDPIIARLDGSWAPPATPTQGTGEPSDSAVFSNSFDPGTLAGWQLGYYWSTGAATESTPGLAAAGNILSARTSFPLPYPAGFGDAYWDVASLVATGFSGSTAIQYSYTWYQGVGAPPTVSNIIRSACLGGETYCPVTEPTADQWPGNYTSNISLLSDGLFKTNTFDYSRVGRAYKAGVSTLVFKFDGGTRYGAIEPGLDNSKMIYEVDSGGNAIGTVRQYTMGKIDYFGTTKVMTKPRTLIRTFPASEINDYRLPGSNTSFIRIGGVAAP